MAFPADVKLVSVTCGTGYDFSGEPIAITLEVTPVLGGSLKRLIHAATGTFMTRDALTFKNDPGSPATFTVPSPAQADTWKDGSGSFFTNWSYSVTVTTRTASGKMQSWIQSFQPVDGQETVDLDLVPDGQIGSPTSAPAPAVTSVNGQSGAVVIDVGEAVTPESVAANLTVDAVDAKLPERLSESALSAAIDESTAGKLDKITAASTYAPLSALPMTVRHGGNAAAERTTAGQITWVGWVQPSSMETQDVWLEIAEPPFSIKDSIGWEALYLASDLTVTDGAPVPVWVDSSGNGHDLTPATSIGAGTPTFKASAAEFNSKPAVAFNASAMWSEVLASPIAQPFTVVAVARGLTNPTGIFGGPTIIYRASAAPGNYTFNPGGGAREIIDSAGTDLKFLMVEFNGVSSTARVNALTALAGAATATASALTQIKVGGHDVGASKQSEIALVGLYKGLLSTEQRSDLFAWITTQYGVTL